MITWTPDLAINVELIDTQHIALFKAVDDLVEAMWDGKGREKVKDLLDFLSNYVVKHFGDEQKLMSDSNYPSYPGHKNIHDQFVRDFNEMQKQFYAGEYDSEFVIKMLDELCSWLRNHIRKMDTEFAKFYHAK